MKHIKFLFALVIAAMTGVSAWAEVGEFFFANVPNLDGTKTAKLEFKILTEEGNSGTVEIYSCWTPLSSYVIPETVINVDNNDITYTITRIGETAFKDQVLAVTYVLPSTITEIGKQAFYISLNNSNNCKLENINFPEGLLTIGKEAFVRNKKLQNISFPSTLTTIGDSAFYQCTIPQGITIPASVTTIGKSAFNECYFPTLTFAEGSQLQTISQEAFRKCGFRQLTLPASVTTIEKEAFRLCENLKSVNLENIQQMGEFAFFGCAFESLAIPSTITEIPKGAFSNCKYLTSLTIPEGVKVIGVTAFSQMGSNYNLDTSVQINISIPASVETIGDEAFTMTYNLANISFAENSQLKSIGKQAFLACNYLEEIVIPEGVTTLGDGVLHSCKKLRKVTLPTTLTAIPDRFVYNVDSDVLEEVNIPQGITSIGEQAFYQCRKLPSFTLPEGLKVIGQQAFYNCTKYTEVTIPSTVDSIGAMAFMKYKDYYTDVSLMSTITCLAPTPPALGWYNNKGPFGFKDASLILPDDDEVVEAYANSPWANYFFIPKTFVVDGVTYRTLENGGVQLGDGKNSAIDLQRTEFTVPESVVDTSNGYEYGVVSFAPNAFDGCTALTRLVMERKYAPSLQSDDVFDSSMKNNCTLVLPEYNSYYDNWAQYFKEVEVVMIPKVFIKGVPYTRDNLDLFGDGKASLSWEYEEKTGGSGDDLEKSLSHSETKGGDDDEERYQYGYPVLTLNGATINYEGEGPAIEVHTFDKFFIRLQGGNNTITASDALAVISLGTSNGEDLDDYATSFIILNEDDLEEEEVDEPTKATKDADGETEGLASLTIKNLTEGKGVDGVYLSRGSFNVLNAAVSIEAPDYALYFRPNYSSGEIMRSLSPRDMGRGQKSVVTPYGPVDAYQYAGYLNIYAGSELTLTGGSAALWGGTGYETNYIYYPGYLQDVGLIGSDKSTYESSSILGPMFFPCGYSDDYMTYDGSYYLGIMDSEDDYDIFPCKYLKFAKDYFTASTQEGVELKFMSTGDNMAQVGKGDGNCVVSTPENWDGTLTVPSTVQDESGKSYNVKGIADKALYQWSELQSITISEGIEYIGTNTAEWGAFEGDYNLTTVSLPSTTKSLANWCFNSCENITDVYLYADDVPSLNGNTFYSSSAILHVPAGTKADYDKSDWAQYFSYGERIVEMEDNSVIFTYPTDEGVLMTFKITSAEEGNYTVQTYGSFGSNGYPVPAIPADTEGTVTIPETVVYEDVTYTVTAIGNVSFAVCENLTGVNIPNTVTSIRQWAFCESGITSITLPEGITSIHSIAFAGCTALQSVYANMTSPVELPVMQYSESDIYYVFDPLGTDQTRILYVPAGCKNDYKASDWWTQGAFSEIVEQGGGSELEPGDVSGDGEINVTDVTALVSIILGNTSGFTESQRKAADLNNDGEVNVTDITALVSIILGQ